MQSFDTILCPVDFSEVSAGAMRYAAMFAECGAARAIGMYSHWFDAPPYFTEGRVAAMKKEFDESIHEAQRALEELAKSTIGAAGFEIRVVEALPVDGILRTARETGAGLIVMGTHGRTGINRWMLGSIAERVLRESPVPVLTVRGVPERPIRHILCPVTDTAASRSALRTATLLGACFDATVTALHVAEDGAHRIPNLCAWIPSEDRTRCTIRELVRHGNAAEEILRTATEETTDLVVMGSRRRSFFEGMVLGTTTLRAVRHAPCPVLSVPGPGNS
jgi:nucleotide-binding universal stress UspA family protein